MTHRRGYVNVLRNFAPFQGPGFWVWFDFSDATTIHLDGSSKIQQIDDKSGNAYNATCPTATRRPGLTTVNGLTAGLFDHNAASGAGTFLRTDQIIPAYPSPFTMFCVGLQSIATSSTLFPKYFTLGAQFFQNGPFNELSLQVGAGNIHSALTAPYTQQLFAAISNGASSVIRLNGSASTASSGSLSPTNADYVSLGHQANVTNDSGHQDGLHGALCECIGYAGILSAADIAVNENYLRSKWGTP